MLAIALCSSPSRLVTERAPRLGSLANALRGWTPRHPHLPSPREKRARRRGISMRPSETVFPHISLPGHAGKKSRSALSHFARRSAGLHTQKSAPVSHVDLAVRAVPRLLAAPSPERTDRDRLAPCRHRPCIRQGFAAKPRMGVPRISKVSLG